MSWVESSGAWRCFSRYICKYTCQCCSLELFPCCVPLVWLEPTLRPLREKQIWYKEPPAWEKRKFNNIQSNPRPGLVHGPHGMLGLITYRLKSHTWRMHQCIYELWLCNSSDFALHYIGTKLFFCQNVALKGYLTQKWITITVSIFQKSFSLLYKVYRP